MWVLAIDFVRGQVEIVNAFRMIKLDKKKAALSGLFSKRDYFFG